MDLFAANVKNTAAAAAAATPPSPFSLKHSFPDRPISCSLAMTSRRFSSSYPFGAELLRLLEIRVFKPKLSSPAFLVRATAKKNHDNSPSPGTFLFLLCSSLLGLWSSSISFFRLLSCYVFQVSFDITIFGPLCFVVMIANAGNYDITLTMESPMYACNLKLTSYALFWLCILLGTFFCSWLFLPLYDLLMYTGYHSEDCVVKITHFLNCLIFVLFKLICGCV